MCDRSQLATQDARARRAARRAGLIARKSRWRANTIVNQGGFRVVYQSDNLIVAGERYDLIARDVIEFCAQESSATQPSV
jgi:hypothetical protein